MDRQKVSTMTTKKIFFFFSVSVFLHTNLTHRGVRHRRQKREEEKKEETRHFSPWAPSSIHFEEKLCVEDDGGASFWQSPPSLSFVPFLFYYFSCRCCWCTHNQSQCPVTLSLVVPLLQLARAHQFSSFFLSSLLIGNRELLVSFRVTSSSSIYCINPLFLRPLPKLSLYELKASTPTRKRSFFFFYLCMGCWPFIDRARLVYLSEKPKYYILSLLCVCIEYQAVVAFVVVCLVGRSLFQSTESLTSYFLFFFFFADGPTDREESIELTRHDRSTSFNHRSIYIQIEPSLFRTNSLLIKFILSYLFIYFSCYCIRVVVVFGSESNVPAPYFFFSPF